MRFLQCFLKTVESVSEVNDSDEKKVSIMFIGKCINNVIE
jgi:hypothetical protein